MTARFGEWALAVSSKGGMLTGVSFVPPFAGGASAGGNGGRGRDGGIIGANGRIDGTNGRIDGIDGINGAVQPENPVLREAAAQLKRYFEGALRRFRLPLLPGGTPFQREVWEALLTIPYGETRSYKEIAVQIGREKACRAVGMAVHANPLAIIVPCHRVIGADGSLTGFAAGLDIKRKLLELERALDTGFFLPHTDFTDGT